VSVKAKKSFEHVEDGCLVVDDQDPFIGRLGVPHRIERIASHLAPKMRAASIRLHELSRESSMSMSPKVVVIVA
jgi:hypothetical protein